MAAFVNPLPVTNARHNVRARILTERNCPFNRWRLSTVCLIRNDQSERESSSNSTESSSSPFAGMAAGPVPSTDRQPDKISGALGQSRTKKTPQRSRKTAADFVAEGIVDDVDEAGALADIDNFKELSVNGDTRVEEDVVKEVEELYVKDDIRFGIADLEDPFSKSAESPAPSPVEDEADSNVRSTKVTDDGSVVKKEICPGRGDRVSPGASVTVEYTGKLADGTVFDTSKKRSTGFTFEVGKGTVIKGMDLGVATMRVGEVAELVIKPSYAYGRRGMPPVIPGNSTLTFKVEVTDTKKPEADVKNVSDLYSQVAQTPQDIAMEYEERMKTRAERRANLSLFERFYIISPFASQTGEKPPVWLDPRFTFLGIFVLVGVAFYLVYLSGAIHIGYATGDVDVNIFK